MQRTRRAHKQKGWYAHNRFRSKPAPPDVAPVGQCAGSTRLYVSISSSYDRKVPWFCVVLIKALSFFNDYNRLEFKQGPVNMHPAKLRRAE